MTRKKQKEVLITGGTGVLGEALVRQLLQEGASVYFTYFSNHDKARELEKLGAKAMVCNFAEAKEVSAFVQKLQQQLKQLDGLIHNAAIVADHTLQNLSEQEWDRVLQVNLKAPIAISYGLQALLKNAYAQAKVFFIISRVGQRGGFGQANYAAAKDGLIDFAQYIAHEWGNDGIAVNCINPGFMLSELTQSVPEAVKTRNQKESLLNTFSDPKEVASLIAGLIADKTQHVSGQTFHFESRFSG